MSVIMIVMLPIADAVSFPAAFGVALLLVLTVGVALWWLWRLAHRRDQTERIREWSISIAKPQALQRSAAIGEHGRQNGRSARHGDDDPALYANVQNLD